MKTLRILLFGVILMAAEAQGEPKRDAEINYAFSKFLVSILYENGLRCYSSDRYFCAKQNFEWVWRIRDSQGPDTLSHIDQDKWALLTAKSNMMVALDDRVLVDLKIKISSAETAFSMYSRIENEFDYEKLLIILYLLRVLGDDEIEKLDYYIEYYHEEFSELYDEQLFCEVREEIDALLLDVE